MIPNSETRYTINAVLKRFGDDIGLENLALDDNDHCLLSVDDRQTVQIQLDCDRDELVLFTDLGRLGQSNRLEICETLLEANLFWNGTDGATVGLERSEGLLFLSDKTDPSRLDQKSFEAILERFINTTEELLAMIRELLDTPSGSTDRPPSGTIRI